MKPRFSGIASFFMGVLLTLLVVGQLAFINNRNKEERYTWQPPALPDSMMFAGEKVPLERWDVKERLDREMLYNTYNQANIIYLLKLAHRYFPVISERLKANGVPDDFKYLCVAESNLVSGAISQSGAVGFWQFMKYTGSGYMEINNNVDERYDVEESTDAACQYLKDAYNRFGSWTAAAASYNCGQGGYSRQCAFQKTKNYYDLNLPEETNRYIFRILTFKQIMEHADDYGFNVKQGELYPEIPYKVVTVTASIPDLAQFAIDNGTNYKILRLLNPWVRGQSLTVKAGKSYAIKLPQP